MRANVRDERLILTTSNGAFAPFLRNWLGGLRILAIDEFVVISLDRATSQLLAALGLTSHEIRFGAPPPDGNATSSATSWYDVRYRKLMGAAPRRILTVLSYASGSFDLLVADVDVAWLRSPWPMLYAASRARCQLQGMAASQAPSGPIVPLGSDPSTQHTRLSSSTHDSVVRDSLTHDSSYDAAVVVRERHPQANCATCLNAGFLFLRRGAETRSLVSRWAALLRQQNEVTLTLTQPLPHDVLWPKAGAQGDPRPHPTPGGS